MLTFLRKIRKSLIETGNTRKYILYAIGEISLVVIGILIALQINNWNIQRQEIALEEEYLQRLKQELLENIESTNGHIRWEKAQESSARLLLSAMNENQYNLSSQTISTALVRTGWTHKGTLNTKVLDELLITGNVRLIRNVPLREMITELRANIDFWNGYNEEFNSFNLGFRRLVGDVLDGELIIEISTYLFTGHIDKKPEDITWTDKDIKFPDYQSIVEELKNLNGIEGFLGDIAQGRIATQIFYTERKDYIAKMIQLIDSYHAGH